MILVSNAKVLTFLIQVQIYHMSYLLYLDSAASMDVSEYFKQ